MVLISLYYWAGAKAAAGVEVERFETETVAQALELARSQRSDPQFDRVLSVSSLLIDGLVVSPEGRDALRTEPVRVEVLPPFAGGNGSESPPGQRENRQRTGSFVHTKW
ncbi:MAG: MoaD/ThiS family protein [Propionibacteriaceae bacterium]